jgi:solute carrier family 35 protein C2
MRENAQIEAHKHHLVEQAHEGSDGDDEDDTEEEDWNTPDRTYVTSDGDILPAPNSFKIKKVETSKASRQARGSVEPSRSEIAALAASKKELSD